MNRKNPFNSNSLKNSTDGNGCMEASSMLCDDHPLIGLYACLFSLLNQNTHFDRVSNGDRRKVAIFASRLQSVD